MKKKSTNQEILLVSKSSFFKRDWVELKADKKDKQLSQKEQLIELCWNGMLGEMLPELVHTESEKPLPLWETNQLDNLLDLRYGDFDQFINDEWSINPYVFTSFSVLN